MAGQFGIGQCSFEPDNDGSGAFNRALKGLTVRGRASRRGRANLPPAVVWLRARIGINLA